MSTLVSEASVMNDMSAARPAVRVLAVAAALAIAVMAAYAWLHRGTAVGNAPAPSPVAAQVSVAVPVQQQLPADVTLTVLSDTGFTPSEISHAAGHFRVVVQNRSGVRQLDLRLDGEAQSRFAESHVMGEVQGWIASVDLAAGTYTITEASHTGWVCHLTVQ